ncbi:MAG: hypothetical protein AB7U38_07925, partial [Hyphomicrobiales bacterium]
MTVTACRAAGGILDLPGTNPGQNGKRVEQTVTVPLARELRSLLAKSRRLDGDAKFALGVLQQSVPG